MKLAQLDLRRAGQVPLRHPHVDNLQGLLKAARDQASDPGALDGVGGARTLAAVKAFQTSTGLEPDGIVGVRTWTALIST